MKRSALLAGTAAALVTMRAAEAEDVEARLRGLEYAAEGRLGVTALDANGATILSFRSGERFPMCSTFKAIAVAAILARVDKGDEHLDRRVHYTKADVLPYAPVAKAQLKTGMTIRELCAAAIEVSDNTAANLLIRELGGPPRVTLFAESIGDSDTILNRIEPVVNTAFPGDARDSTTPNSMANTLRKTLLGSVLTEPSRNLLRTWMLQCKTGATTLRAGVPKTWQVADKTGSGGAANAHGNSNTLNDIAVMWTPKHGAVVVTAFLTGSSLPANEMERTIATIGRITAGIIGPN